MWMIMFFNDTICPVNLSGNKALAPGITLFAVQIGWQ